MPKWRRNLSNIKTAKVMRQLRKKIKYIFKNKLKEKEIRDFHDREFKISILKKLNKM